MEKKFFKTDFIWDLETFPNCFTACFVYGNGKGLRVFEISDRKNETEELLDFLRKVKSGNYRLVGFNSVGFDYPILHYILTKARESFKKGEVVKLTAKELYKVAMKLIESQNDEDKKFGNAIRDKDVIIPQVDLYLIHHFNNRARSTSLKMLEVNMRSEEVEDLPFPVGKTLTAKEMDVLIKYNKKDVLETLKFYHYSYDALNLRVELAELFGFDCTNYDDTKIGAELFIRSLEQESPGCCYTTTKFGRKMNQTKRSEIVIKDCLLPYIKFDRPEFQAIHEWFKKQVITETKGVFSDLLEHELGDVAKYAEMVVKKKKLSDPHDPKNKRYVPDENRILDLKKEYPMGWIEEKELKSPKGAKSYYWCWNVAETLNVVIDGFRYDYGTGGIHGAKQGTIRSTATKKLRSLDVRSYYPTLSIANEIYPAHLGKTFCKTYKKLYNERAKHPKKSGANAALKLALNGVYGKSNSEYSPLYDPAYTMAITICGQLSLCMLMEKLINECDAEIVMCNTDGFEYIVHNAFIKEADELVKEWERITGLEMEGVEYDVMYIRDVNSYTSITDKGEVKTKGAYEVAHFEKLGWQKNHSAMVIPMAVHHELMGKGNAEDFIKNHKDPYDFMLRAKIPRSSRLVLVDDFENEEPLQNICRYYPSDDGGKLIKIMPPIKEGDPERRLGMDVEWKVMPCNDMKDFNWNINYDYYIQEANKLIDAVK